MNRYRKIFHHITAEDVAKDNLRLLNAKKLEEKKIEEDEKYVAAVAEELHCDWRVELDKEEVIPEEDCKLEEELYEGMTTSTLFAVSFGASDADLIGWDHTDENGDAIVDATDFFRDIDAGVVDDTGESYPGLDGNAVFVKDGLGAGTGNNLGFNIHGTKESYMWMAGLQGSESSGGFFRTSPLDGRFADTISVTAIVGNGSNGGTAPHASSWGLYVYHWHPGIAGGWTLLGDNAVDYTLVPANGAGELTTYTLNLPEAARVKDLHLNFGWYNQNASIYAGDIGITQIGIRRNTPKNVVMPLDDPQASAFIRTGEQHFASKGKKISGSKEERYKRVVDMLNASQEYTQKILGMQFPGANTVLFGDEVKETDLERYQAKERARYSAQVEREFQQDPSQHGSKAWRARQKELYPHASSDRYADWADQLKGKGGGPLFPEGYRAWVTKNQRAGGIGGIFSQLDDRAKILQHLHPTWASPKQAQKLAKQRAQDRIDKSNQKLKDKWARRKAERQSDARARQDKINQTIASRKSQGSTRSSTTSTSKKSTSSKGSMSIKKSSSSFNYKGQQDTKVAQLTKTDAKVMMDIIKGGKGNVKGATETLRNNMSPSNFEKLMLRLASGGRNDTKIASEYGGDKAAAKRELQDYLKRTIGHSPGTPLGPSVPGGNYGADRQIDSTGTVPLDLAWGKPKVPTSKADFGNIKRRTAETDAMSIQSGMGMSPEAFKQKYGISHQEWLKLPQQQSKKSRSNVHVAHYEPVGSILKETTFEKIKRLRKTWDYKDKPSPDGEPKNPPPEMVNGFHPEYGKHAARYKKLDPQSAKAMPPTGDPETDALVKKQAKKPK